MVTPDEHRSRMRDLEFEKIQRENELKRLQIRRHDPENPMGKTKKDLAEEEKEKRRPIREELECVKAEKKAKESLREKLFMVFVTVISLLILGGVAFVMGKILGHIK